MVKVNDFFKGLYSDFNERSIDAVISQMTADVKWANGMEGGFVHGREEVRAYWKRQFSIVSSMVTPVEIEEDDGKVRIKVHQVVHDLNGNLLSDILITHIFTLKEDKIATFEIGEQEQG